MTRPTCAVAALLLACAASMVAQAEPWIGPGDAALRHDVQLLADAGVLRGPVLSWPLPWSSVVADLDATDLAALRTDQHAAALRLRQRARLGMRLGELDWTAEIAGASEPERLRTFDDAPREQGEAAVSASWLGRRFAWKAVARVVADPEDGQVLRPDGSYGAAILGNWILSAGYVDRWWGPGWQGSLILSNNARPLPGLAFERNQSRPFDLPVLRWLGPWRFNTFMGRLEGARDHPHALLFGMRAEIRPLPSLQLAASRTAQWCGDGRPCGLDTFGDLLLGNDNDQPLAEQPGNQLAGFDLRWSWPGGRVPLALYAQGIGEDEAGFLPSKYLGLLGVETWGRWSDGSWRVALEYADTACDFVNDQPQFGCAYASSVYTSGYRHRGRAIGHALDGDGEMAGLSARYVASEERQWGLEIRSAKLNRAGLVPAHSLSAGGARLRDLALTHDRPLPWGNMTLRVGHVEVTDDADATLEDGPHGSVTWRYEFR